MVFAHWCVMYLNCCCNKLCVTTSHNLCSPPFGPHDNMSKGRFLKTINVYDYSQSVTFQSRQTCSIKHHLDFSEKRPATSQLLHEGSLYTHIRHCYSQKFANTVDRTRVRWSEGSCLAFEKVTWYAIWICRLHPALSFSKLNIWRGRNSRSTNGFQARVYQSPMWCTVAQLFVHPTPQWHSYLCIPSHSGTAICAPHSSVAQLFVHPIPQWHSYLCIPSHSGTAICASHSTVAQLFVHPTPQWHSYLCIPLLSGTAICASHPTVAQLFVHPTPQWHSYLCIPSHSGTAICASHPTVAQLFVHPTPQWHSYLCIPLHSGTAICASHSSVAQLFVHPIPQWHSYLCIPLHSGTAIWASHSTVAQLFVHPTPQWHSYLSIPLHSGITIWASHPTVAQLFEHPTPQWHNYLSTPLPSGKRNNIQVRILCLDTLIKINIIFIHDNLI